SQHDAAFYLRSEALGTGFLVHVMKSLVLGSTAAVFDAVKSFQVGTRLRRSNEVIGGNRIFRQREVEAFHKGAQRTEGFRCPEYRLVHFRIDAILEVSFRKSDLHSFYVTDTGGGKIEIFSHQGGRISWIMPGNGLQE